MLRMVVFCFLVVFTAPLAQGQDREYDIVVYGGTSAAVTSAVQARLMGKSTVIVSPDKHLGGLSSGGLGWTDSGNKAVIGGLSRQFYHRVWRHYDQDSAWKWQTKSDYGNKGQGTPAIDKTQRTMWIFEPSVAEKVFDEWVAELKIPVVRNAWLDRESGVTMKNGRIQSIRTLDGATYSGRMFIDATYEGDLMAAAGVSYHVGREATSVYKEKWNGVQTGVLHHGHWFKKPIDPYVKPGDPTSGLLPRISSDPPGEYGAGDQRIQAYCFRMCLTKVPENRIPFPKPENYDPQQYELLGRVLDSGWREVFQKFDPIPNGKTDTNNHGPFSTDNIGMNYDYPEGSYERRREIIAEHQSYQMGLMYFLANDPRVPEDVRKAMSQWGLAKNEFQENGNWPHQIYVREARRMLGRYVMTEHDCFGTKQTPEPVGMGSYTLDSHNVQRYVKPDGFVQNEGDIGVKAPPYAISYGSLTPKKSECHNLLVPVAVSSSHIAFGSIRMEPVFMILGQSAATAAALSLNQDLAVQDLPYETLRKRLLADGQVLEYEGAGISIKSLKGIVLDDTKGKQQGAWRSSATVKPFLGAGYLHDNNESQGKKSVLFTAVIPQSGRYEVRVAYSAQSNRASNAQVLVEAGDLSRSATLNQRKPPAVNKIFSPVGIFAMTKDETVKVTISNQDADGYVIVDGIQIVPVQ